MEIIERKSDLKIRANVVCQEQNQTLPNNLSLTILDDRDSILEIINAKEGDEKIRYWFTSQKEEKFSLKITLNSATFRQYFM